MTSCVNDDEATLRERLGSRRESTCVDWRAKKSAMEERRRRRRRRWKTRSKMRRDKRILSEVGMFIDAIFARPHRAGSSVYAIYDARNLFNLLSVNVI